MPTFEEIYAHHAVEYDALVSREDYQNNLLPAIRAIALLENTEVVELGAGTGRITRLLAPHVKFIRAFDRSAHMLMIAEKTLKAVNVNNYALQVAENNALPVPNSSADLSIAGWSFGHVTEWHADRWRDEISAAVHEMKRVLRPNCTAIIIETMGTGSETPAPPNRALADYYAYLESDHGFTGTSIRTDYRFESLDEVVQLTGFFFGDEMAARIKRENLVILPECTGIWWCKIP
jgi:ubiquinone/menaquinone biosynthesis C-methylase UbiE